jgi:hypothetical protein
MKKVVYKLLKEDDEFNTLFPNVLERGAIEDVPMLPCAVIVMTGSPRQSRAHPRLPRLEVWLYQERGDYSKINAGLIALDRIFEDVLNATADGERIAEADPQGWSSDLYDDIYKANTRNAAYLLVGTPG